MIKKDNIIRAFYVIVLLTWMMRVLLGSPRLKLRLYLSTRKVRWMEIQAINELSSYLTTVKNLWYPHKNVLGFFPDGAFLDYAKRRQILVAINSHQQGVGYLIYRISNMRVTVVHLCVHPSYRGSGVAKSLINELCGITKKYIGIGLRCRRDFEANNIWPQLGFIAINNMPGRSYDGKLLTFWWIDHGHPSLFSFDQDELLQSNIVAAMDANVFFDLFSDEDTNSEESKSLLADWLSETLKLCLTEEIYNEIDRSRDTNKIFNRRESINLFTVLKCSPEEYNKTSTSLRPLFPQKMKKSDQSDLRQLSRAICCKVHFFITRDAKLLGLADEIYEKYGTTILRPSDLIIHVDELINGARYQPARLAGSLINIELIKTGQVSDLMSFQNFSLHESKADFLRKMRTFLASPTIYETKIVKDAEKKSLALIVYCREKNGLLDIPICRVVKGPLGPTIAKHLILKSVLSSSRDGLTLTKVSDNFLSEEITSALTDSNFRKIGTRWLKFNINLIDEAATIGVYLQQLSEKFPDQSEYLLSLSTKLIDAYKLKDLYRLYEIERALWPMKIADSGIPTYIVPIKPKWASELFDEHLANQSLYGCKPELALNRENVFYRSAKQKIVSAPGRIVWYVSKAENYTGAMSLRACSYIDGVVIDKPKELYRLFRRLGVYEWKDVYQVAKNNCDNEVMAIRFSDTELFDVPMSWNHLKQLLHRTAPIQSPVQISDDIFTRIYKFGSKEEIV